MSLRVSFGLLGSLLAAGAAIGCGSKSNGAMPDDAGAADAPFVPTGDAAADAPAMTGPPGYPATHPSLPTVASFGGPVLATPRFIPITFPNDTLQPQIDDFISKLGASSYWAGNVGEYGVGPGTMVAPVHFPTNPFLATDTDDHIQSWLAAQIENGALPAYATGNIYAVFLPSGTSLTLMGGTSCTDFGGYHNEAALGTNMEIPYAAIPRCESYGGLTGIDVMTGSASHELIEAATDPFPQTMPAYAQVDGSDIGWMLLLGGGEIGDMCAQNVDAFFIPPALPYTVQRTWSNKAAKASTDPCVPAPSGVYFNAAAVVADKIPINLGNVVTDIGVKIPVGQSKTIPVDLFSDAPMTDWSVSVDDGAYLQGGAAQLSFKLNKSTGKNGDQLQMTITVLSAGQGGIETFALASQTRTDVNLWIGLVSSQ